MPDSGNSFRPDAELDQLLRAIAPSRADADLLAHRRPEGNPQSAPQQVIIGVSGCR